MAGGCEGARCTPSPWAIFLSQALCSGQTPGLLSPGQWSGSRSWSKTTKSQGALPFLGRVLEHPCGVTVQGHATPLNHCIIHCGATQYTWVSGLL